MEELKDLENIVNLAEENLKTAESPDYRECLTQMVKEGRALIEKIKLR